MTIADKIQVSADKTRFTLFKEGLFYTCYNQDAMVFAKMVKNYKVNSKFVKSLGATVFFLGFPVSEVEKENLSLASFAEKIGAKGSVAQGVQQPFEISVITGLEEAQGINLSVRAYPNPTTDYLTLSISEFDISNLLYQLYDMQGKLL